MKIRENMELLTRRLRERGVVYSVKKAWVNLVRRPVLGRIDYLRYRDRYPEHLIFIAGQAKGGSTWFGKMFASLPGFELLSPLPWKVNTGVEWTDFESTNLTPRIFDEFHGKLAVVKQHTWGFPENVALLEEWKMRHLISVRDPRDILISNYYYAQQHPENWDHGNAKGRSLEDYLDAKLYSGDWNRQFVDWARSWAMNRNPEISHVIRYEDALEDTSREMRKALDFFGFTISIDELERIVRQNSFEAMSGRKQGQEDTESFHRKGIAGEWREVFTAEQKRIALEQAEDVLGAFKYSLE